MKQLIDNDDLYELKSSFAQQALQKVEVLEELLLKLENENDEDIINLSSAL